MLRKSLYNMFTCIKICCAEKNSVTCCSTSCGGFILYLDLVITSGRLFVMVFSSARVDVLVFVGLGIPIRSAGVVLSLDSKIRS